MEFYQLRYFARAAKYENISIAAQELHVTQPSISKAIKALEQELGVDLMKKNGKYCALTHEGRLLQAKALSILSAIEDIPREMKNGKTRQWIRLNALSAGLLIPELIRKFHEVRPDISFNVMEQREAIGWDVCIRSTLPEKFFNNSIKLMDEELLLACKKSSPLAKKGLVTLNDLRDEDFIELKAGGSIRLISDKKFKEMGFIPQVAFECENFYILKRMVKEGLGVAVWPQYSWREQIEGTGDLDEVCLKPIDIPDFCRSIYLIRQKDLKILPEIEEFIKFTTKYFSAVKELSIYSQM